MSEQKQESVYPFYRDRVEMAMKCRHGISASQREVMVVLAMRCYKLEPKKTWISIEHIAGLIGRSPEHVYRCIKKLKQKELIDRDLDAKTAYGKSKETRLNWPKIAAEQFVYVPETKEGSTIKEFGDLVQPSPKSVNPSEPQVKGSATNEEPFQKHQEPKKQKASGKASLKPHVMEWVPLTASGLEPMGELLVRLMEVWQPGCWEKMPHPFYAVSDRRRLDAIEKLREFDDDEQLRDALGWCLRCEKSKWYDELRNKSRIPHSRLAKVRDLVVEEYEQIQAKWRKENEEVRELMEAEGLDTSGSLDRDVVECDVESLCERYAIECDESSLSDAELRDLRNDLIVLDSLIHCCNVEDLAKLKDELANPTGRLRVDDIPGRLVAALWNDNRGERRGRKCFQLAQTYAARCAALRAGMEGDEAA